MEDFHFTFVVSGGVEGSGHNFSDGCLVHLV